MNIEQIKNRITNGYYKEKPYVQQDIEWLVKQYDAHIEELAAKTEALNDIKEMEWKLAGETTPIYMLAHDSLNGNWNGE